MMRLTFKPLFLAVFLLLSSAMLTGCLFEGEQSLEKLDSPEQAVATEAEQEAEEPDPSDEEGTNDSEEEASTDTVSRELYLFDSNGMVVPQTLELPASKEVATQALEYLVKDGPVTNLLPNGFQAVLPAGTEILGLNPGPDGTMIVDVSEEFKNYNAEDEEKILQAMTYTLTQFEGVERIKLWINGYEQKVMPVDGTPIGEGLSRADGINNHTGDYVDVAKSKAVTVYFPSQIGDHVYQVPVTTRVKESEDVYATVVQALLDGPALGSSLLQPFNAEAEVVKTDLNGGVLSVSFNEAILTGDTNPVLSHEALASLVMSLTDLKDVESVEVKVEGVEQVINEAGDPLVEPVSRTDLEKAESL